MSAPRTVPSEGNKDLTTFTILIDGQAISKTIEVAGITVFKALGKVPHARIEILDGDPSAETFKNSEDDLFKIGGEIEINVGYNTKEERIFKGTLVSQKIRFRRSGRGLLTLICRHPLYASTLTQRSKIFVETKDSDVISDILGNYNVSVDGESTSVTHEALHQNMSSDWDFALTRAKANGLFLTPTDDGVSLIKPDFSKSPVLDLILGATILELDIEKDCRTQPKEWTATAWDKSSQEMLESSESDSGYSPTEKQPPLELADIHGENFHLSHSASLSQEELDALTSSRMILAGLASHVGRVQCTGSPLPLPGETLSLNGLGAQFNGTHYITAIRHCLNSSGEWITDIQIGLDAQPSGLAVERTHAPQKEVSGLHIGIVEALSDDPESEFRVQISIPSLGEDVEPLWARLGTVTAGDSRGTVFYPDISDEVVISFLNNDPRHPVILGSLYSSSFASPIEPNDDNYQKGYISREGLSQIFDDEKKSILFETPNGNIVTLSDDDGGITLTDENGNSITLNSDGIELNGASDINIKAAGDVKTEGTNIESSANAQLTVKGSAGAEISSSGSTVVKGSMVQIN